MHPVESGAVASAVARPYTDAPPVVQRAVRTGTADGGNTSTGLYARDDTYYAVTLANPNEVFATAVGGAVAVVLGSVGVFVGVAGGLVGSLAGVVPFGYGVAFAAEG